MTNKRNHYAGYGRWISITTTAASLFGGLAIRVLRKRRRELLGEVCSLFNEHVEIAFCEIEAIVDQGAVTLRGDVRSLNIKRLAENIARSIEGVNKVSNQL